MHGFGRRAGENRQMYIHLVDKPARDFDDSHECVHDQLFLPSFQALMDRGDFGTFCLFFICHAVSHLITRRNLVVSCCDEFPPFW